MKNWPKPVATTPVHPLPLLPRKNAKESRRGKEQEEWREQAVMRGMGQLIPFDIIKFDIDY